jgi:hypothetical protein
MKKQFKEIFKDLKESGYEVKKESDKTVCIVNKPIKIMNGNAVWFIENFFYWDKLNFFGATGVGLQLSEEEYDDGSYQKYRNKALELLNIKSDNYTPFEVIGAGRCFATFTTNSFRDFIENSLDDKLSQILLIFEP